MKIKLTESQFKFIFKEMRFDGKSTGLFSEEEPVTELYKSTYNNAAAQSLENGEEELALDFLKHSNEMGIPKLKGVYPPDVDGDGDTDADDAQHCTYSDHCDFDDDGYIDDTGEYIGITDIDADGIPDYEDEELAVDRFNITQRIKSELNSLNEYYSDPYLTTDPENKWDKLERDVGSCITDIIETHKDNFGYDSYGVIDAIYQVMDGMFPKV